MSDIYEWVQRGKDLMSSGDIHAAATVLERAIASEPAHASLREQLARAYYQLGRYDSALDEFREAIQLDPADDYAYFGAGLSLAKLGRLSEAVGQLRMAVVMRPQSDEYRAALQRQERRLELRARQGDDQ
jgi:tetratricopeptide (TPR) repeat protein